VHQSRRAFTLVEMMIVLVTLVIVAAAVVPMLHGAARQGDLDSATARIAASARYARETAITQAVTIDLIIATAPPAIELTQESLDTTQGPMTSSSPMSNAMRPNTQTDVLAPLPARYAHVPLPDGITAQIEPDPEAMLTNQPQTQGDMLRFPPDGHLEGGMIVLHDVRGRERRIVVTAGTGKVSTDDGK
jgi:prepilin-type N-terminal cleavage/methylation domain-containing protein